MLRGSSKQLKDIAVFILNEQYRPSYGYVWYQDHYVGHDSSVSIATGYGLDGPGIESRYISCYSEDSGTFLYSALSGSETAQ